MPNVLRGRGQSCNLNLSAFKHEALVTQCFVMLCPSRLSHLIQTFQPADPHTSVIICVTDATLALAQLQLIGQCRTGFVAEVFAVVRKSNFLLKMTFK